jgi:SagB-type dehydrogenase family enzyme
METGLSRPPLLRPRSRQRLAVTPMGESLLIEGGPSRQVLNGKATLSLVPRLLKTLDGRRSREQLARDLALSDAQVDQAVRLLDECGLLEWVPPDAVPSRTDHVAAYLSRTIAVSESCPSADDVFAKLSDSTVLLAAPRYLAEPIAADLSATGVGTVEIMTAAQAARALPGTTGACVAAVFDELGNADALNLVAASARDCRPVLRISGTADWAEVGPAFCGPSSACIDCFRRSQPAAQPAARPAETQPTETQSWSAALTGLLASLATSALLGILTGQGPEPPLRKVTRVVLSDLVTESQNVTADPECARCAGGTPPASQAARDLLAYEWQSARGLPWLDPADATTPAKRHRFIALERERDSFPGYPRHSLPDQAARPQPAHGLTETVLAAMMARVAGFVPAAAGSPEQASRRWAPSGGNLGSVAIYLITDLDLFGLPGTIFRYDDLQHEVIGVRADRVVVSAFLDATDLDATGINAVVVTVAQVGRLKQKYGDFAWRLAHLDAGCAALQLHLIAEAYDLRATFAASWPAELAELLDLDKQDEVVTAIAGLAPARYPRPDDPGERS